MERDRYYELKNYMYDLEEKEGLFEEAKTVEDFNFAVEEYDDLSNVYEHYEIRKIQEDEEIDEYGLQEAKEEAIHTIESIVQQIEDLFE